MNERVARVFAEASFLKSPPVIFSLCLFFSLLWLEHAKDHYARTFEELTVHGTNVAVISVTPKEIQAPYPTVIYLHGSRGSAIGNGRVLRQFADAGFAAVTMEYSQDSQESFNQEMPALFAWLQKQGWADTNRLVWVGFSLGSQRMLDYYLNQPGQAPQVLVRVGGGVVDELADDAKAALVKPKHTGQPQVLLFHGEQDRVFPLADVEKVAGWLKSQRSSVSTWVLPGADHAFGQDREWVMRCVTDQVADVMSIPRTGSRPFGMLHTAKVALAAILIFLACWLGPKLLRPQPGESKWFRRVALGTFALAMAVTAYHLILPRVLTAGEYSSWFAHDLGTDPERVDLKWLAAVPEYQNQTCYNVMQQVRLAHFRKSFLYHELPQDMFRNYVLTSKLSPDENPQMDWRWPLWLELYPKVRKCTNAEEAAEIVVRATRERLGLPKPGVTPFGILGSWWHGTADSAAYPKTLVAALRSAGVAAKLDDTGQAQFWTGKEWKLVMERDRPFDVRGF